MKREYLDSFKNLSEERKEELMINAIKAAEKLHKADLNEQIKTLRVSEKNPRVRDAAIKSAAPK
jgi:hypothetical protein